MPLQTPLKFSSVIPTTFAHILNIICIDLYYAYLFFCPFQMMLKNDSHAFSACAPLFMVSQNICFILAM